MNQRKRRRMNTAWTSQNLDSGLIDQREKVNISEKSRRYKIKWTGWFWSRCVGRWQRGVSGRDTVFWLGQQDNWQEMNGRKQTEREKNYDFSFSLICLWKFQEDMLQRWLAVWDWHLRRGLGHGWNHGVCKQQWSPNSPDQSKRSEESLYSLLLKKFWSSVSDFSSFFSGIE